MNNFSFELSLTFLLIRVILRTEIIFKVILVKISKEKLEPKLNVIQSL